MESGLTLPYIIIFFVLTALLSFLFFKNKKQTCPQAPKLPPGSMGWPYLGETLQLFSHNPNVFFHTRHKKYGDIFKTHILGCPSVMLACPEAARFVLVTHAHLFKPIYPKSKEQLIGQWAVFFHQGVYHTRMRKLIQASLSLDVIRNLVPAIEDIAINMLDSWCHGQLINTFHEIKKFTFDVAVLSIFGELDCNYGEQLKKNYFTLDKGYNCFPINLPGTSYRKAYMARRRLGQILRDIINDRREKKMLHKNFLNSLLNFKDENGESLNNDQIADNIIGVLFAAQDTTASVLTWILKYLHDDPELLHAVKMEQKAVYEANDGGNRRLTWAQTRNMPITQRVIMESLRMASIISFTYREAVEDVEYKGILIPKGWKVLPLFRIIHHNPDFFTDPENFDPSRFEVAPKPNSFMPFGNGSHACPGNEVAKLEMLILVHHFVNNYRWEVVGAKRGVRYDPFPVPKGLSAKFWKVSVHEGIHT